MALAPENLEWSLGVPSVKELIVVEQIETVPPRYIREDVADYPAPSDKPLLCVPLIDMAKLVELEHQEVELQKLHAACRDWGVFQLVNHGVSGELLRDMKKRTQEFFDLPLQAKKRYEQKPGGLEGYGQHFVISEEQKLEWCDMFFLRTLPTQVRNLEFWPRQPPSYRDTIDTYSKDMRKVAVSMVGYIAMGLGLDAEEFSKAYQDGKYQLRLNCYPPCPEPKRVLGVASHTDITGITLLLDCGEMPGLQVLKDGKWVSVKPISDAIVVNIGNILEIMSNGIYKAPYHRAVVDRRKERLSIVTFCYPTSDVEIGPAKELINKTGNLPLYKTLTHEEYLSRFFNWKLDRVPFIDTLKI